MWIITFHQQLVKIKWRTLWKAWLIWWTTRSKAEGIWIEYVCFWRWGLFLRNFIIVADKYLRLNIKNWCLSFTSTFLWIRLIKSISICIPRHTKSYTILNRLFSFWSFIATSTKMTKRMRILKRRQWSYTSRWIRHFLAVLSLF